MRRPSSIDSPASVCANKPPTPTHPLSPLQNPTSHYWMPFIPRHQASSATPSLPTELYTYWRCIWIYIVISLCQSERRKERERNSPIARLCVCVAVFGTRFVLRSSLYCRRSGTMLWLRVRLQGQPKVSQSINYQNWRGQLSLTAKANFYLITQLIQPFTVKANYSTRVSPCIDQKNNILLKFFIGSCHKTSKFK